MTISLFTLSSGFSILTISLTALLKPGISALPVNSSDDTPLPFPQPITLTDLQTNFSNINASRLEHEPTCFLPSRWYLPIAEPSDCDKAITDLLNEGRDPEDPVLWTQRAVWSSGTCNVVLHPRKPAQDVFTREEIAYDSRRIKARCVTEGTGFLGGSMPIGNGKRTFFDVKVFGRNWPSPVPSRLISSQ